MFAEVADSTVTASSPGGARRNPGTIDGLLRVVKEFIPHRGATFPRSIGPECRMRSSAPRSWDIQSHFGHENQLDNKKILQNVVIFLLQSDFDAIGYDIDSSLREVHMFNHLHYVPILKWKLGEYQALSRLSPPAKDRITPLLEIPAVGYDFEKHRTSKSLDDHVADFGRRLKSKWQARPAFVDARLIEASERMADGTHPLSRLLTLARSEGCHATPVIALNSSPDYLQAAAAGKAIDNRGVCLRLQLEDFDRANLVGDIKSLLRNIQASYTDTHLVVDLGEKQFLPVTAFVQTLITAIRKLPALNRWCTFSVAGTSYPASLAAIDGTKLLRRNEWTIYRALVNELGDDIRIPTFGDYAVAHPDPVELDMRLIKPFAKLRYTTPEDVYIAKGRAVRTSGFDQYRGMCQNVTRQPFFDGAAFSDGDRYIFDCANGNEPTGNLTTWVWVSTNRHMTRVVADLANFHGP